MTATETQAIKSTAPTNVAAEASQTPAVPKPEGEALEKAIRDQIEYYLSVDNLKTDSYLLSKMSSDMWVEIALLCRFRGLLILNANEKLVVEAMKKSKSVSLNSENTRLRPNVKVERKTIIIRDLPADADEKDVRNIFSDLSGDSAPVELRSEFGGNWFITFGSEECCVAAHNSLVSKKFRDQVIHARIKSETLMKSFYQPIASPYPYPVGMGYEFYDPNAQFYVDAYQQYGRGGGRGANAGSRNQPRNNKVQKKRRANSQTQPIQLGPNHFPPLPTKKDMQDVGIERVGYGNTSFKEYSAAEIIKILEEMSPFSKPEFHMSADIIQDKSDLIPVSKIPLVPEEARDVFFVLDGSQDRSRMSMSPFVSPFFASVPVPAWPTEHGDILGPSASPMKKEARAMKVEKPIDVPAPAPRVPSKPAPATISTMITPPTPTKPAAPAPAVAPVAVAIAAEPAGSVDEEKKGSTFRDVLLARKTAS